MKWEQQVLGEVLTILKGEGALKEWYCEFRALVNNDCESCYLLLKRLQKRGLLPLLRNCNSLSEKELNWVEQLLQ